MKAYLPQWVIPEDNIQGAVDHLRLNPYRDILEEILFPYVSTNSNYLRTISWILWIEETVKNSDKIMSSKKYIDHRNRLYNLLAIADTLHNTEFSEESIGPEGVTVISEGLQYLTENGIDTVDLNSSYFSKTSMPKQYATPMEVMGLCIREEHALGGRSTLVRHIPIDDGLTIIKPIISAIDEVGIKDPLETIRIPIDKLRHLGELVHLHEITKIEKDIFTTGCQKATRDGIYDSFIEFIDKIAKEYLYVGEPFHFYSIEQIALFNRTDELNMEIDIRSLKCTHYFVLRHLHWYFAKFSLNILASVNKQALKKCPRQLSLDDLLDDIASYGYSVDDEMKTLDDIRTELTRTYGVAQNGSLWRIPPIKGKYSILEILGRVKDDFDKGNFLKAIIGSCVGLIGVHCIVENIDFDRYDAVADIEDNPLFSSAILNQWIDWDNNSLRETYRKIIHGIIIQHRAVCEKKGPYSFRCYYNNGIISYKKDMDPVFSHGRLQNAFKWLADLGKLSPLPSGCYEGMK